MTSENDFRTVDSAEQLLEYVNLTSITYFEYSGKRKSSSPTEDDTSAQLRNQLMHLVRPELVSIRCQTTVKTENGEYIVDLAADYSASTPIRVTDKAVGEFTDRVAMTTLWPYVRIAVQELTTRLEGRGVVLGLHIPAVDGQVDEAGVATAAENDFNTA